MSILPPTRTEVLPSDYFEPVKPRSARIGTRRFLLTFIRVLWAEFTARRTPDPREAEWVERSVRNAIRERERVG